MELHPSRLHGGRPAIFGKRVTVDFILGSLANGLSVDEVAMDFNLPKEAVIEALKFAAKLIEKHQVKWLVDHNVPQEVLPRSWVVCVLADLWP